MAAFCRRARAVARCTRARIEVDAYAAATGCGRSKPSSSTPRRATCRWPAAGAAGEPIHDMILRLAIDGASTSSQPARIDRGAVPRPLRHDRTRLRQLVGLNLLQGFRRAPAGAPRRRARLHAHHRTGAGLPTAAVQAFAGDVIDAGARTRPESSSRSRSTAATRCARWPGGAKFYPRWHRRPQDAAPAASKTSEPDHEDPRIPRQGNPAQLRRAGAARLPGLHRARGDRGRAEARRRGLGGQGADPRRRPRQGRRRQAGALARRGQEAAPARSWACS